MKRNLFNFLAVVLLLAVVAVSCKPEETPLVVSVTGVTLEPTTLVLTVNVTKALTVTVHPADAANKIVRWTSTDDEIATAHSGNVTAKAPGKAIITVTTDDGSFSAICRVEVTKPHPAEPELIWVEGGKFMMGCTDEECWEDGREVPAHQVTLTGFNIAKNLVTQKQWELVMGSNPSHFKGDNLPVEMVSWQDAQDFIKKLNELTGKEYRLATEAEWEYAARGGNESRGYRYSGSDNINDVAWYKGNAANKTYPVGTKDPNELGIYDMSGNVEEWCNDRFGEYTNESQIDPQGPATGLSRVSRNGSWYDSAKECRVSYRKSMAPGTTSRSQYRGFRLAHP